MLLRTARAIAAATFLTGGVPSALTYMLHCWCECRKECQVVYS